MMQSATVSPITLKTPFDLLVGSFTPEALTEKVRSRKIINFISKTSYLAISMREISGVGSSNSISFVYIESLLGTC